MQWCTNNVLTINASKTKWMVINQNKRQCYQDINMLANNRAIEQVDSYNYLGVIIDASLNFQAQRNKMNSQVQQRLNYLTKIRSYVTTYAAKIIYKTTILPIIDYGDFIYDQGVTYTNRSVQQLQNRGLRIVYNQHLLKYNERMSTAELHALAGQHRLSYRRSLHLLLYAYDLSRDPTNVDNRQIFTRIRGGTLLIVPKVQNVRYYKSLFYRAVLAWNNLDPQLTLIDSKGNFKNAVLKSFATPFAEP